MKRKIIASMIVATTIAMVGCAGSNTTDNKDNESKVEANVDSNDEQGTVENYGYTFVINDIEINMHEKAEDIIAALGQEKDYFESQSCAFPGLDKVYTYNGFEVTTYPKDDVDYISGVSFMDDTVETKEGVYLFQTVEDMKKAYGENYTEENGIYTYVQDKTELTFMVKNDEIVQIEYMAVQE